MKKRKMAMVSTQIRMDEEDLRDVSFWLGRPASERIAEVTRLRISYYRWLHGDYPNRMEKVINTKPL